MTKRIRSVRSNNSFKSNSRVLDQWYTSPKLAKNTIDSFYRLPQSQKCKYTVEPSAGEGILLDLIKGEKVGFDLDPKREDIIKHDFLQTTLKSLPKIKSEFDLIFAYDSETSAEIDLPKSRGTLRIDLKYLQET